MKGTDMQSIGFIGLGNMGGNMADRYLTAGYTVYGEDRDREHAQWLVDKGLRFVDTPRAVAAAADVILTSLPNDEIVRSVAAGRDGIVEGLSEGKVWADLSTISPSVSREVAAQVRATDAQMLDTPVSGSVPQVKSGTLTIMAGGDADAYGRVESILRVLGTPTRIGDNGQGLVLKLAINISLAVQTLAFSEGLLLAEHEGIDPQLAAKVMSESPIGSPMLRLRVPLILNPPHDAWFDIGMMHKDIRLARQTGRDVNTFLPATEVADRFLDKAEGLGYAHSDIAAMREVLERLSTDMSRVGS
jgi:3-hydroxyisobutyrate dehydrogenase-like beta-hydroxyacid dehydrogenase